MNYNWCHGPNCHKHKTQDRLRGNKGSKVLRTRKITWSRFYNPNNPDCWWMFFCCNPCRDDYINKHIRAIVALEPRREPRETPVTVERKKSPYYHNNYYTEIKERVDNA